MENSTNPAETPQFSLDFPRNLGNPHHRMGFRTEAEDFRVVETLGFTPAGEGEHLYLRVQKTDENTRWIAHQLSSYYDIPEYAVGFCGLKDRRAVTTQWFSVHLPGAPGLPAPVLPGTEILEAVRHTNKLKPGMHVNNRFRIILRGSGDMAPDINVRLKAIADSGVPNYFGEQRFGRDGGNLREVAKIVGASRPRFKGKRGGLYLSAARSWLFNQVLAVRVRDGGWLEIPDGPLWGRGRPVADASLAREEAEILSPWADWRLALEHSGLKQERRALVLNPGAFAWRWQDGNLELSFTLPPGGYATAVLREIAVLRQPEIPV